MNENKSRYKYKEDMESIPIYLLEGAIGVHPIEIDPTRLSILLQIYEETNVDLSTVFLLCYEINRKIGKDKLKKKVINC